MINMFFHILIMRMYVQSSYIASGNLYFASEINISTMKLVM